MIITLVLAAAGGAIALFIAGRLLENPSPDPGNEVVLVAQAVALAPLPDGDFLWADIEGTVHDSDGLQIARIDVSTVGQRGLLGITTDAAGRVFVAYTDPEFFIVVAEISGEGERRIWVGPKSVQGGNGGRLLDRDGSLILAVGLLNDRANQSDPESVTGKLIALDPDLAPEQQEPVILSGPWNNPFAFDVAADGALWVADNHPSDGEERLARGDLGIDPDTVLVMPSDSAPTGMAARGDSLYICLYNLRELQRYDVGPTGAQFVETVATDCLLDAATLSDGSIIYSTGAEIRRLDH